MRDLIFVGFLIKEKFKTKKLKKKAFHDIITNYSKLVFNQTIVRYSLNAALILIYAYVNSQTGDIKRIINVYDNLCLMIKTNVQSEIPLSEQADVDLPFCQ